MIKPQSEFPLLDKYKEKFAITENTIFAYDGEIYSNNQLPDHLIVHELTHHKQQDRDGLDYWVENYLNNPEYRLKQEIEAYKNQLSVIKDRNDRFKLQMECAINLSSDLYGNIISYSEAMKAIKV